MIFLLSDATYRKAPINFEGCSPMLVILIDLNVMSGFSFEITKSVRLKKGSMV